MADITHVIVFSVKPEMPHKEFFEHLCGQVKTKDGQYLYCLDCTECDLSHPIYLDVTAVIQTTGKESKLLIPHSLVLAIVNVRKGERGIGFLSS
jgi:hypothetical protein